MLSFGILNVMEKPTRDRGNPINQGTKDKLRAGGGGHDMSGH